MLGAVKMEGHEHTDWSNYYGEPEVRREPRLRRPPDPARPPPSPGGTPILSLNVGQGGGRRGRPPPGAERGSRLPGRRFAIFPPPPPLPPQVFFSLRAGMSLPLPPAPRHGPGGLAVATSFLISVFLVFIFNGPPLTPTLPRFNPFQPSPGLQRLPGRQRPGLGWGCPRTAPRLGGCPRSWWGCAPTPSCPPPQTSLLSLACLHRATPQ